MLRKQIAAANWKMNLSFQQAEQLLDSLVAQSHSLSDNRQVILAVPFPYLDMAKKKTSLIPHFFIAAQNCYSKKAGAFTGETSADMLVSLRVTHVLVGHSERREYFSESNQFLAEKIDASLAAGLTPVFCCGEALPVREAGTQNAFVAKQLSESLFHLDAEQLKKIIIAYEPIWAIGTGKTASSQQAQEMHAAIRSELQKKYDAATAESISILYGGSVKGSNAAELFAMKDVDGGLVGGASLDAAEFSTIIDALK